MQKRKMILLCACALLLFVCIVQAITKNKNTVRVFTLKEEPDSILIENGSESVSLVKNG